MWYEGMHTFIDLDLLIDWWWINAILPAEAIFTVTSEESMQAFMPFCGFIDHY